MHVLLIGEKEISASPLICNAEVTCLSKHNEIESFYLCYLSSPYLETNELTNGVEINVNKASSSTSASQSLSSLILKESSPSLHSKGNISSIQYNSKAKMQSFLNEFRDVFSDDLPPGLPPERIS